MLVLLLSLQQHLRAGSLEGSLLLLRTCMHSFQHPTATIPLLLVLLLVQLLRQRWEETAAAVQTIWGTRLSLVVGVVVPCGQSAAQVPQVHGAAVEAGAIERPTVTVLARRHAQLCHGRGLRRGAVLMCEPLQQLQLRLPMLLLWRLSSSYLLFWQLEARAHRWTDLCAPFRTVPRHHRHQRLQQRFPAD